MIVTRIKMNLYNNAEAFQSIFSMDAKRSFSKLPVFSSSLKFCQVESRLHRIEFLHLFPSPDIKECLVLYILWQLPYGLIFTMTVLWMKLCVQLYNNSYPFSPIPSCVAILNRPSNKTPVGTSGIRPIRSRRTEVRAPIKPRPAGPHAHTSATKLEPERQDGTGLCGPHQVSQPIGGSPHNPSVHDRTIGDKWDEAVQRGCTGE